MGSEEAFSRRISARVRAAIEYAEQPYTVVGERAGIPKSTFERKYKGRAPYTTDELAQVAEVLGIEPEEFCVGPDLRAAS